MASAVADSAHVGRTYTVIGGISLARPNFKYEKRQKELAKQKKAEEKRLRKMEKRSGTADEGPTEALDSEGQPLPVADEASPEQ
jgi:hypothetical protein